jgi:pimeloyl-ACP methyl ester carboxylesterase
MSQLPMRANLKNNQGDQQSRNERHTFVLVHGGWCGGWIWRYVAPALRERGHVVTTPTLTGLGERRHSENRTATLSTHIEDIVAHIEMEGFQDVILVSQSYGGMVATGTLARTPDRIRSMIYLDAFVPEDGKSLVDCFTPDFKADFVIYKDEDRPIPPLPLSYLGITDPALVEFMTPRLVNQPWRTLFEPVKVIPRPAHVRMSYVRCTANTVGDDFDRIMERVTRDPNVQTATIDTTHLCMLTVPEVTAKTILDLEEISE